MNDKPSETQFVIYAFSFVCGVVAATIACWILFPPTITDRTIVKTVAVSDPVIAELADSHRALVASQTQWYEHIEGELVRHETLLAIDREKIQASDKSHFNIMAAIASSEQRVMEELENWRNEQ